MSTLAIRAGVDDGELIRLQSMISDWPEHSDRARRRALRALAPWLERETLRAAVAASGINAFTWRALARFQMRGTDDAVSVWLGTNEIPAHHLGDVRWARQMPGASAGGRVFPRSWSWEPPIRTGGLLMRRTGAFGLNGDPRREKIDVVFWEIHAEVFDAIESLMPNINARYRSLMIRELDQALEAAA